MNKVLIVVSVLLCPAITIAQTIAFLDEGINTQQFPRRLMLCSI